MHESGPEEERGPAPAATVHQRAAEVIDEQREKMFANVASAVDGKDPEGVHDMRVASRRLRACLKVFEPWLDSDELGRIAPAVRNLTRALGRVREIDVLRLGLAALAKDAKPERALAIECIDARLARRRSRERERMMARFGKVGLDRLDGRLRRLCLHLARSGDAHAPALETESATAGDGAPRDGHAHDAPIATLLQAVASTLIGEAHDICTRPLPPEIGTAESAEALHAVRIDAKKLRYQLEIVAPYLGDTGHDVVRRLRALQDKLGDFHDDTVLDEILQDSIERAAGRERTLLTAELRRLRSARRRVLARNERQVRIAIASATEKGFVAAVAGALAAAGVEVGELPSTSHELGDAGSVQADAPASIAAAAAAGSTEPAASDEASARAAIEPSPTSGSDVSS